MMSGPTAAAASASSAPSCISFTGCSWLLFYHLGVMRAIVHSFPPASLSRLHFAGASCGSLVAAAMACNVAMQDMLELANALARVALARHWGPVLGMSHMVNTGLQKLLPDDAHVLCSNRLHVSLTSISVPPTNVIVSSFTSKQDLIHVLLASCYIPLYYEKVPAPSHAAHFQHVTAFRLSLSAHAVERALVARRRLVLQYPRVVQPRHVDRVAKMVLRHHKPRGGSQRARSAEGLRAFLFAPHVHGRLRVRAAGDQKRHCQLRFWPLCCACIAT